MKQEIKKRIIEWALNGVSNKEIQNRLSWLGIHLTINEIIAVQEEENIV